jgi:hypothetical protein
LKADQRQRKVAFADERVKAEFEQLKVGRSEERVLAGFLNRAIAGLLENPLVGVVIPKRLWPREYVLRYRIDNLRKYDLPGGWRLIYSIKGNDVEIIAVILEWFDHKGYEKRFGYRVR